MRFRQKAPNVRAHRARREFVVPARAAASRLDTCLARFVRELSPQTAELALQLGSVFVNGRRDKNGARPLRQGDHVEVYLGGAFQRALSPLDANSEVPASHREVKILHEDDAIVVVVKPSGLLSAPTQESDRNNLLHHLTSAGRETLFIVHRLDMQTSGVMVLAKTQNANRELSERFRRHDLLRRYDAFSFGRYAADAELVDLPLRGKRAVTHVEVVTRFSEVTRLRLTLETGRTHQIRLHLKCRGTFVLGDSEYGQRTRLDPPRLALHAATLEFAHPEGGQLLRFDEPLPEDLAAWASQLVPLET